MPQAHTYTHLNCCDFCKVAHEQERFFRRVVSSQNSKFTTVWQAENGELRCAKTGALISQTYIKTESRNSHYRWCKRKAKLRGIRHKDGTRIACEHCHKREHAAGNCKPNTRPKTQTKFNQTGTENEPQPQLFI